MEISFRHSQGWYFIFVALLHRFQLNDHMNELEHGLQFGEKKRIKPFRGDRALMIRFEIFPYGSFQQVFRFYSLLVQLHWRWVNKSSFLRQTNPIQ